MRISNKAHLVNANEGLEAAAQIIVEDFVIDAMHASIDYDEENQMLIFEWEDDE